MSEGYEILNRINSPEDVKAVNDQELGRLCGEIRDFLIENVSQSGGHLASNLGVVELSVALHRVFSTPKDHIIWDVGHQSYVHKMLTGRRGDFSTLRQPGGLSGFEKRSESEHDCFGTGHSSTSISAALGFAQADRINGERDRFTVAVVGDGAFTGGMIHEAINNCDPDLKLIIVINENEMSISKNIGRFAKNLSKLRSTRGYGKTKRLTRRAFLGIPLIGKPLFRFIKGIKKIFKNILYGSNYFEDMGLYYIGPVDGNNIAELESALYNAKVQGENAIVHIKTKKGLGYEPAETDPGAFHSMSPCSKNVQGGRSFSQTFGEKLTSMAEGDGRICAITAAMCDGTGLVPFKNRYPGRFFDVGIAEAHALTFAAGLAAEGMKPFVAIYSTFLQRGYDSIIHDIALQKFPVALCIDRAGLNESDGATHHGIFDVAFLSHIPGMTIYAPASEKTLEMALLEAAKAENVTAVRYASGCESREIIEAFYPNGAPETLGVRSDIPEGEKPDVLIITYGRIALEALMAKSILAEKGIKVGIALLEKLKPYDETADRIAPFMPREDGKIVFLEEEIKAGGMGMMLSEAMRAREMLSGFEYRILATEESFCIPEKGQSTYEASRISAIDIVDAVI